MTLDERLDLIERITGEYITVAERIQRHREAARFNDPDEGDGSKSSPLLLDIHTERL